MGLLGDFGNFIKTPEGQGLLSAAFGGMAGARPGQPWNTAGRAGLAGLLGYQNAQENQQASKLADLKTQSLEEQMATQAKMREAAKGSLLSPEQVSLMNGQGPTLANADRIGAAPPQFDMQGYLAKLWAIDPMQAMQVQASMAKETPFSKVDPKDYTPESVAKFAQTRSYADLQPVRKMELAPSGVAYNPYQLTPGQVFQNPNQLMNIGPDGQFAVNQPLVNAKQTIARAGASNVNVMTKQETEEAKTVGKGFGDQFVSIQQAGTDAGGKLARLDRMSQLIQGVNTGKLEPARMQVSALADSFGLQIDPNLPAKQAIEALSNELALQARNPSGGAGMPGAMSDKDREFLVNISPGLSKTPEGNALIIDTARKLARRDQDVARLAREYRKRHGTIDEGFYDELQRFSAANPLFNSQQPASGQSGSGAGWSIRQVK